jgi:Flp pilus assembly protein TadG
MKRTQKGFAHLALVLLILVVAIVAFAGYKVVKNRQDKTAANTTSTAITNSSQTINSKADLDKASSTLNSQSVDSDLNPASLDSDISNLL